MAENSKWLTRMTWMYLVVIALLAAVVVRDEVRLDRQRDRIDALEKRAAKNEQIAKMITDLFPDRDTKLRDLEQRTGSTEANRQVGVTVSDQALTDITKLEKRIAALEAQQKKP